MIKNDITTKEKFNNINYKYVMSLKPHIGTLTKYLKLTSVKSIERIIYYCHRR